MKFLEMRHEFELDAMAFGTLVGPLLHHYKVSPRWEGVAERLQLAVLLRRDENALGDSLRVWESAIADGRAGHIKTMAKISVEIQKAMRAWTSFLWCTDPANLHDRERTATWATYWALKPFIPKAKNAWTYDPLENDSAEVISRAARSSIEIQLLRLATLCRLRGEEELADYYAPARASWFVENVFRSPKALWELFDRERKLVRAWGPLLGHAPQEERFAEVRERCALAWSSVLRSDVDWRFVTPMVENEVMAALEMHQELPVRRHLELWVESKRSLPPQAAKVLLFPKRAA